jgi:hypothetical protein
MPSNILNKPRYAPPEPNTPSAIIDLSAPTPLPGTISSPFTNEVPPLLINKVFPAYMRHRICFQCQRTGHFKLFCPYYHCENCKQPSPQYYLKHCPFHYIDSPSYHSKDDNDKEEDEDDVPDQLHDDEYDDIGRGGVWGNVLGESIRL